VRELRFKVTTNGGIPLLPSGTLAQAQHTVLANRTIPVFVRSIGSYDGIQHGWVFEVIGNVVVFTAFGEIKDDETTEQWCPWMLTLRTAVLRAILPTTAEGTT